MSISASDKRKIGEIRPSQLLYTYGVGAIVELPNLSVMVMVALLGWRRSLLRRLSGRG